MATSRRKRVPKGIQQALKRQAIKGEIRQPDLAKLVAHFFKNAGGEGAVAKMLYDEFVAAPPGGIARQRIMDMQDTMGQMREGTAPPATVILEDPFGNSAILGEGAEREAMTEKEADQLKVGMFIFDPSEVQEGEGKAGTGPES